MEVAAIDKKRQRPAEQFHQDKKDGGAIVRFETSTDPLPLPIFVTRTTLAQLLAAHPAKFTELRKLLSDHRESK
ncbi:MAG: hypothetical protein WKG03_02580 [Telluria sp.]